MFNLQRTSAIVLFHIALYSVPQNFQDIDQVLEHKDRTVSLHCCRTLIALHSFFHIFERVENTDPEGSVCDAIDTTTEILHSQNKKLKLNTMMRFVTYIKFEDH